MNQENTEKNEAKILYDMYVATNTLKDCEYTDVKEGIYKVVVAGKSVKVYYTNGMTASYTDESE
jgi:hypothetical protein